MGLMRVSFNEDDDPVEDHIGYKCCECQKEIWLAEYDDTPDIDSMCVFDYSNETLGWVDGWDKFGPEGHA